MILVQSRRRASYLYGTSANARRELMALYALQWAAIHLAEASGCTEFDLFGVSPRSDPKHPLYGLYRFKVGFGGSILHHQGCWDCAFD